MDHETLRNDLALFLGVNADMAGALLEHAIAVTPGDRETFPRLVAVLATETALEPFIVVLGLLTIGRMERRSPAGCEHLFAAGWRVASRNGVSRDLLDKLATLAQQ